MPIYYKHAVYVLVVPELHQKPLRGGCIHLRMRFATLDYCLCNINTKLLDVEPIEIFQPLPLLGIAVAHTISLNPAVGLIELHPNISEVVYCLPPPLVFLIHIKISCKETISIRMLYLLCSPVNLRQEPANATLLY